MVDDDHRHEECCVLWRGASQGSLPVDKIGIHHCFRHTDHHLKKKKIVKEIIILIADKCWKFNVNVYRSSNT